MTKSQRSSRFIIVLSVLITIALITVTSNRGSGNWSSAASVRHDALLVTQFLQQGPKLVGSGAVGGSQRGYSVTLSGEGNTALVGGPADNSATGGVWVWIRIGGVWSQQGPKLVGSGATGSARQGAAMALSADGNTALIGGPNDTDPGAAWVWTRSGGVWTQQGPKLVGTGAVGSAGQGVAVSLSADGNTALIGGVTDNSLTGAAWVWTRSGEVWTQQGAKLVGSGAVGAARQGHGVSLSSDGNTALVGGFADDANAGAVWVWTRSGVTWTQQGSKLVGSGAVGAAQQGYSVSLSADGNTALAGGYRDNAELGAAWVWTRSGNVWTQQGSKLVGSDAVGNSRQGVVVSLSADGNTAISGGYLDNANAGAAWVWTRSGGVWTQQGTKLVGTGAVGAAQQGFSVSLSGDGLTALTGGYVDSTGNGAAWVFSAPATVSAVNNTNDSGAGSLRQAILDANAAAGLDNISFAIPGGGVKTISPLSALPTITDPVVIDGTTQGVSTTPLIELNGLGAGVNVAGLRISAGGSTVKGLAINRFSSSGIRIDTNGGNTIQGNFIGTDPSGSVDLGNGGSGVNIENAPNNLTGGTVGGARNIISGNNIMGVNIDGSGATTNQVQGNFIGTDATGTQNLGNGGPGVRITASNVMVGGTTAGTGNTIAFNGANSNFGGGVQNLIGGTGVAILGNSIFSNAGAQVSPPTGLGIDLGTAGVTLNDDGDGDTGPNNLQNFPVLTSATSAGGTTTIQGTLNSTANATFRVEFFSNPTCDPSGNGEGQTFLGSTSVTTVGNNAAINAVLPVGVALGQFVTATATDPNSNTSEFSACLAVTAGGTPTPTATPTATPTSTPTSTPTATPTPGGAGFEGDLAPRPNGDGIVVSNDVVQMRRFATGLDTPNPAFNEQQRADCAPRSTFGDGSINSGDVVQTRRYATGLDPLTDAGGPTGPSFVPEKIAEIVDDIYSYFFGREIRVGVEKAVSGETVTVPVEITPYGDEMALSFTLEYDATRLANPRVVLGEGPPEGAVLTVNTKELSRIGILIDSIDPITASAMPKRIVMVTFDVVGDAAGDVPILVTGTLAAKGTSDAAGNMLATRYADGLVRIGSKE